MPLRGSTRWTGIGTSCLAWYNHPDFVDDRRRDRPHVADLRVPTSTSRYAIQRAVEQAVVDPGVIFWLIEKLDAVVLAQIVVQAPKLSVNRGGIGMREVEVICALVLVRRGRAVPTPCGAVGQPYLEVIWRRHRVHPVRRMMLLGTASAQCRARPGCGERVINGVHAGESPPPWRP